MGNDGIMNRFRERYNELTIEASVIESVRKVIIKKGKKMTDHDRHHLFKLNNRAYVITFIQEYCIKHAERLEGIQGQTIDDIVAIYHEGKHKPMYL